MLRSNSCQKNKQLFREEGGRRIPQQQSGLCSLLALGSGPFIRPVDSELHAKAETFLSGPGNGPASLTKRNYRSKLGLVLEEGRPPPLGETYRPPASPAPGRK